MVLPPARHTARRRGAANDSASLGGGWVHEAEEPDPCGEFDGDEFDGDEDMTDRMLEPHTPAATGQPHPLSHG